MESLFVPLLSAAIGWAIRHYGLIGPATPLPQSRQGAGGTVLPGPALADLPSMIASVVETAIEKALAKYLPPPAPTSSAKAG